MNGCPLCGGVLVMLGQLGELLWFRCRACGCEVSAKTRDAD